MPNKVDCRAVRLARVFRGENIESEHFGHAVLVDATGTVLHHWGDAGLIVHMRSAAKPFQILPALRDAVAEHFHLQRQELALACASHNGEAVHTMLAAAILKKTGLSDKDLQCGSHRPLGVDIGALADKPPWSVLHNNCSGKHALMLAACVKNGWPLQNYLDPQHPHQQRILHTLAKMGRIGSDKIGVQIDGCSAPEFSLPLQNIATLFANLAALPETPENSFDLMREFPYMVAGKNRFDTAIIEAGKGKFIAKTGAEGLECFAIRGKKPLGLVISIADGNGRAAPPVALKLLTRLNILNTESIPSLHGFLRPPVYNHRKRITGHIECALAP